jgi:hypothetical protein
MFLVKKTRCYRFAVQRAQRRWEREKEEALEGDYMDYEITWIKAHMILLIHVIS